MKTIYLDNSTLEIVAKCDTATILGAYNELGPAHESAPLAAGTAVHAALALHLAGATKDAAMNAFTLLYYERGIQELDYDRMYYENVRRILDNWLDLHPLADWLFSPIISGIEQPLSWPLYEENGIQVIFVGLLDALVRDKRTNQLDILDHKTTGLVSPEWKADFHLKSQIDGYLWLAQNTWPDENVSRVYINALELSKIPNSNRKCREHGTPYSECGILHPKHELFWVKRTPEQLNAWQITSAGLARDYIHLTERFGDLYWADTLSQQGKFNGSCRFCNFKLFCEQSRPLDHIESLFVHKPWRSLLEEKVKAYETRNKSQNSSSTIVLS